VDTNLTVAFADGEYLFRLGLKQINEIQNTCGAGIGTIFARLSKGRFFKQTSAGEVAVADDMVGDYWIEDIVTVIRQALIGGGKGWVDGEEVKVDAARVNQLIENYVLADDKPIGDAWTLAHAILFGRIRGYQPPGGAANEPKKDVETTD
jgi:hypothetical protein